MPSTRYAGDVSFEDFDPNASDKSQPIWATYDGYRFKTHSTRAPALNAVMRRHRVKLYTYESGRWKLVVTRDGENRPALCDHCGLSTMGNPTRYDYTQRLRVVDTTRTVNLGEHEWQRQGGKILDPPVLMYVCKQCQPIVVNA